MCFKLVINASKFNSFEITCCSILMIRFKISIIGCMIVVFGWLFLKLFVYVVCELWMKVLVGFSACRCLSGVEAIGLTVTDVLELVEDVEDLVEGSGISRLFVALVEVAA